MSKYLFTTITLLFLVISTLSDSQNLKVELGKDTSTIYDEPEEYKYTGNLTCKNPMSNVARSISKQTEISFDEAFVSRAYKKFYGLEIEPDSELRDSLATKERNLKYERIKKNDLCHYAGDKYKCKTHIKDNSCVCHIKQPLDHNNNKNDNIWFPEIEKQGGWNQYFWVRLGHYVKDKPIFLDIGGENSMPFTNGETDSYFRFTQSFKELSKKHASAHFSIELRYFGWNETFSRNNAGGLKWLTVKQQLNDLVTFKRDISKTWGLTGPWIIFGCSYAGSLATWLKKVYPDDFAGAVASSGPIIAKADNHYYNDAMFEVLDICDSGCSNRLIKELEKLVNLAKGPIQEWKKIDKTFGLEIPFDGSDEMNISQMLFDLLFRFGIIVQQADHGSNEMAQNLTMFCSGLKLMPELAIPSAYKLSNLAIKQLLGKVPRKHFSYNEFLHDMSAKNCHYLPSSCWLYLACNEVGWFQTLSDRYSFLSKLLGLKQFSRLCTDLFGPKYTLEYLNNASKETNAKYGGLNIGQDVKNLFTLHGSFDTWRPLGRISPFNPSSPSVMVDGGSHCPWLWYPDNDTLSTPSTREAKEQLTDFIKNVIEESKRKPKIN